MDDPWAHRSDGMRCKTCMWFAEKRRSTGVGTGPIPTPVDLGRCRRHAPTLGGYPAVFVNDWCGDHKLDENAVPPMITGQDLKPKGLAFDTFPSGTAPRAG